VPEEAKEKLANDLANLQSQIQAAEEDAVKDAERQKRVADAGLVLKKFIEVTRENSKVLSGADAAAPVEFSAKTGEKFLVLDKANGFYAVSSPDGKTGWITTADVKPTLTEYKLSPGYDKGKSAEWFKGTESSWDWSIPFVVADTPPPVSQSTPASKSPTMTERVYKVMADAAISFKDSYKDNPYFNVTGFTVVVTVPPALNLEFSFK